MNIWAHALVKNEAKWLWFSVASVINHVDKLLLWDTGSTDRSWEVMRELERKYPDKIVLKRRPQTSAEDFTIVRQEMLDETEAEWILVADGDEIWYEESIKTVIQSLKDENIESIIVPTINLVGDIFHYQDKSAGRYKFGNLFGHYNLRAFRTNIPGLHSHGAHGVWGWEDEKHQMIQDRDTFKFVDAPYLHATNLERSIKDPEVIKRKKKLRYELGHSFPKDFYYPEVFFRDRPGFVESPWKPMTKNYQLKALYQTPLRRLKRKLWHGSPGY